MTRPAGSMSMLHLIHPALVHFAIAFLIGGGLVEVSGILLNRQRWAGFGAALVVAGTVGLLPVLASGHLAANSLAIEAGVRPLLDAHERNAWFVLAVFTVALFWKGWCGGSIPPGQRPLYVILLLAAVVLTAYSAFLGGQMVYLHGVGQAG
jgi:uncharacterized membrane protein